MRSKIRRPMWLKTVFSSGHSRSPNMPLSSPLSSPSPSTLPRPTGTPQHPRRRAKNHRRPFGQGVDPTVRTVGGDAGTAAVTLTNCPTHTLAATPFHGNYKTNTKLHPSLILRITTTTDNQINRQCMPKKLSLTPLARASAHLPLILKNHIIVYDDAHTTPAPDFKNHN